MSTTAMVARRVGEKKRREAAIAGSQAILLGVLVSLVMGIPSWFLAPRLLEMMGARAQSLSRAMVRIDRAWLQCRCAAAVPE